MPENSQSWRKKMRIKYLVDIAENELSGENYECKDIERIRAKLDSEMKSRWNLIRITRKDYLNRVEKILRKEYVLNP